MDRVYLCNAFEDQSAAGALAQDLEQLGYTVYFSESESVPGENILDRLGAPIESSQHFILFTSPHSAISSKVRYEVAWALRSGKSILPILFEPASFVEYMFLVGRPYIDFSRLSIEGETERVIKQILYHLGGKPAQKLAHVFSRDLERNITDDVDIEARDLSTLSPSQMAQIYIAAIDLERRDIEHATFLARTLYSVDPDFQGGQLRDLLRRMESHLKREWPERLFSQAQIAYSKGAWKLAKQYAQDVLALEGFNLAAKDLIDLCERNQACDPQYELARLAAHDSRWSAAAAILKAIRQECPEYGDPAELVTGRVIDAEMLLALRVKKSLKRHSKSVNGVALSPDSARFVSVSEDQDLKIWDLPEGNEIHSISGHRKSINCVAYSPDGRTIATGAGGFFAGDNTARIWEAATGVLLHTFSAHTERVNAITFTPDSAFLVSGSADKTIKLWSVEGGQLIDTFPSRGDFITALAFSQTGSTLITGDYSGKITIWDLNEKVCLNEMRGHTKAVRAICVLSKCKLVMTAADDGLIVCRSWHDLKEVKTLDAHAQRGVSALAASPSGELFVSADRKGLIKFWSTSTWEELIELKGHHMEIQSLAFSRDGKYVISASMDRTIRIWGLG